MHPQLALLIRYLRYYRRASTRHDVHSPFVYAFIEEVLRDKRVFYDFDAIEQLRRQLLHDRRKVQVTDLGAGSLLESGQERSIASIARSAAKSRKYGQLLFRIAHHFQPRFMIELGTSLGLSTAYLAAAGREARMITLEGCEPVAAIARENLRSLQLNHVRVITGNFDDTLAPALDQLPQIDLAFIDGNHREEPTIRYFHQCLAKAHPGTLFIFDDIHWTKEMEAAWETIKDHPAVTLSIDLFFIGLVFFKNEFREKQHFVLKY